MSLENGNSPYTREEVEAIRDGLRAERERRRRLKMVNPDGIVLFSQAEQSEMVAQIVKEMRKS